MKVTREIVVKKLVAYLDNQIELPQLVDWAEEAIREGDFVEKNGGHQVRDVVARLGLADVKAFGLDWEDHKEMLNELGYKAQIVVQPEA